MLGLSGSVALAQWLIGPVPMWLCFIVAGHSLNASDTDFGPAFQNTNYCHVGAGPLSQ